MSVQKVFHEAQLDVVEAYRRSMFECVVKLTSLGRIVGYVLAPENDTHLGYHNPGHCMRVAMRAWELANLEGETEDVRLLIIAALFHDFGHTGKRPDIDNIEIAVKGMRDCPAVQEEFCLTDIRTIEQLIRVTEFPFIHDPKTPHEKIIRDADMMESFEPYHIKTILYNLREELEGVQGKVSVKEAAEMQERFIANIDMLTDSGRLIWQRTKPFMLDSMYRHAEIAE